MKHHDELPYCAEEIQDAAIVWKHRFNFIPLANPERLITGAEFRQVLELLQAMNIRLSTLRVLRQEQTGIGQNVRPWL